MQENRVTDGAKAFGYRRRESVPMSDVQPGHHHTGMPAYSHLPLPLPGRNFKYNRAASSYPAPSRRP